MILVLLLYGVVCEKVLFIRFQKTSAITFMLASMSLSTVVKNIALKVFGALPRGLSIHYTDASFTVSGMRISSTYKDVIVYIAGLVVLGFFPYGIFRRVKSKY